MAVCAVFAGLALVIGSGHLRQAAAVVAGGLLALVSYRMIVASAGGLARVLMPLDAPPAASPGGESPRGPAAERSAQAGSGVVAAEPAAASDPARGRPSAAGLAAGMAGRYALLALLAYVMIARLRLPPLGLLAGASSVVAAVGLEAVRFLSTKRP